MMKVRKYRIQPWIKNSLETLGSKKSFEWIILLHIFPIIMLLASLFYGDNHLLFFLMGYVWDAIMFVLLSVGFFIFDIDWND